MAQISLAQCGHPTRLYTNTRLMRNVHKRQVA